VLFHASEHLALFFMQLGTFEFFFPALFKLLYVKLQCQYSLLPIPSRDLVLLPEFEADMVQDEQSCNVLQPTLGPRTEMFNAFEDVQDISSNVYPTPRLPYALLQCFVRCQPIGHQDASRASEEISWHFL
jgi:hypothetical protein